MKRRKQKKLTPAQQLQLLRPQMEAMQRYIDGTKQSTVRVVLPRVDTEEGILGQAIRGLAMRVEALEKDVVLLNPGGTVAANQTIADKLWGER